MDFYIPTVSVVPIGNDDQCQPDYYDMFTNDEILENAHEYIGNDELFGIFRLKILQNYKRNKKQENNWEKLLEGISKDRDVEYIKGDTRRTVYNIMKTIPDKWIHESMKLLNIKEEI